MKNSPLYQPGAIGMFKKLINKKKSLTVLILISIGIGITLYGGEPKIGQLLNSAWTYADICRFQILTPPQMYQSQNISSSSKSCTPTEKSKETADRIDMPPPPSPASSTCSDTGSSVQNSSN